MQYLNLILLAFCLVIVALIVFILGKRLRSFLTPAVAAAISTIIVLSLPTHSGNAAMEALLATVIVVILIAIFVRFESK